MPEKNSQVVTRFAPSPTGVLHIGGVRTALFNYLYAKKHGGKFILRIEDTDKERSTRESEEGIVESLSWLGLRHDEFYRQSDRTEIYQEQLFKLIKSGYAYEAEENKDGIGKVIRFKNPNKDITFADGIVGEVTFNTEELGDFVIARDIDSPIFHFTVVVDDGLMGVTNVIRGQEHLNSTARQILLLEALGFNRPNYSHIPLIMSPRGGKLSKRDPEVMSVMEYREAGYLKDAVLNFLAFIGWNPGDDREIMSVAELTEAFTLEKVQKGGAAFNSQKLDWINKQYIQKLDIDSLRGYVKQFVSAELFAKIDKEKTLRMLTERLANFRELQEQEKSGEFIYLFEQPTYNAESLVMKNSTREEALTHLKHIKNIVSTLEKFDTETVKDSLWDYATEHGRGNVLWPFRYALTGKERSPDPFNVAELLGKSVTIERVQHAIDMLQ